MEDQENIGQLTQENKKINFEKVLDSISEESLVTIYYDKNKKFDSTKEESDYLLLKMHDVTPFIGQFCGIMVFLEENIGYTKSDEEKSLIIIDRKDKAPKLKMLVNVMRKDIFPYLKRLEEVMPEIYKEYKTEGQLRGISVNNLENEVRALELFIAGASEKNA